MTDCAGQALQIAERIDHRAYSCEAKGQLAASYQVIGRVEEAARLYEESIAAARNLRHLPALLQSLTYRGVVHFFRSEYDQAVAAEMEAAALASESRNGFYLALSRTYLGYSLANQGRISDALNALTDALSLARRNENRIVLARAPNGIGWIYREIGVLQTAIEYDEACVETASAAGAAEAEANALINLVYDYSMAGEHARIPRIMDRLDSLYDREQWNRWRFYEVRQQASSAEYWLAMANLDRAEGHARTLLANAQRYGVPKYVSIAYRILGEIAELQSDPNKAEEQFIHSINSLASHQAPLVEWRNHAAMGRLLQRLGGRPAAAQEAFRRAAELVHRIAGSMADSGLESAFLGTSDVRQVLSGC
jgi:tetratricopeptide (TPR) repeat protein